ncbi:unnamed protein product [Effrenium voratum]|nr:unnamed protein product [Effrenium voratum]
MGATGAATCHRACPCRLAWTIRRASGLPQEQPLPPGFMVTSHPEGHSAPQSNHTMSDKARESFVISAGDAAAAVGSSAMKLGSSGKASSKSKKSKKKKSSGCC